SLIITKFHQSVVCSFLKGIGKTGVVLTQLQREKSTSATYLIVRHCGNFSTSVSKEITKARYFTLEEALQRSFDDDEKSEIDFVVISPLNQRLVEKNKK
ncbi:hypothetical protein AVEN_259027-1, partial [Araneus ventricosus]